MNTQTWNAVIHSLRLIKERNEMRAISARIERDAVLSPFKDDMDAFREILWFDPDKRLQYKTVSNWDGTANIVGIHSEFGEHEFTKSYPDREIAEYMLGYYQLPRYTPPREVYAW